MRACLPILGLALFNGCYEYDPDRYFDSDFEGEGDYQDKSPSASDDIVLSVSQDAFICNDDYADMNLGSDDYTIRAVGKQNAYTGHQVGRSLYKFELPTDLSRVSEAYLLVQVMDNFAGFPTRTVVRGAGDDWSEDRVTWNTQPSSTTGILDSVNASCCDNAYIFDVTSFVQDRVNQGADTLSFIQSSDDEGQVGGLRWWHREGHETKINFLKGSEPRLSVQF